MTANPPRFLSPTVSSSQKVYSGSDGGGDVDGPSFLEGGEDGRTHSHGEVLSFSVKKEQPSSNSSSSIGCIICGSGGGRGGGRGGSCGHDAAAAAANSPTKTPRGGSSLSRPDNTCSVSSPTPLSNQKFTSPSYQCRCEQRRLELEKWREERKRRGEKEKLQATTTPPPFQTGSHVRQERIRKQQQTAPTPLTSPSPHRQRALRREDLSSPYRIAASPVVKKKTTAAAVGPTCSRRGHSIPTIPPSSSSTSSSVSGTKKKLQPKKKNSIHMDPSNAPTTTTSTNDEEQRTQTAGEGKETMTPSATTDVESIVADIEAWSLKMRHVVEDAARRSTQQANQNIKLEEDKRVHGEEGQGGGGFRFDEYLKPDTPDRDDENMEEDDEQAASYEKSSSPAPAKPYAHHDMPPQDRSARPIKMEENDEGEGAAATEPNADHTDNMATFRSLRTPTGQIMQIENQGHEPVESPSFHVFSPKAASAPATPPPPPPPTPLDEGQTGTQNYRETSGAEKSSSFHATNTSTPAVGEEFRESIRYMIRTLGEQLINIHNVSQASNNDNNNTINTPTNSNSTLSEAQNQLNQTTIQLSQTLLKIEQKAEAMIHVLKLNDARTEALQRENKELRAMIKRALEYQAVRHEIHTRENAWEERFNSLISSVRSNRYQHHHHHAHDPTPPPRTSLVSSSSPYETPTTTRTATTTRTWNVNSNGVGSGARRPVSQGRFTDIDSRDTTATTGNNNTTHQNDVRKKNEMIRGSRGVDVTTKATPLMKRLDATNNTSERDIFDSKNQQQREEEENDGDYLLSRHGHRPNVYPAVQQSPGTMFVSELSEVMELDEGHHWRLADIMDKNWSRG